MVGETDDAEQLRAERMADKAAKDAIARATLASPDQSKRYAVPTEGAASLGPDDAPVVIVEFVDFACPYCRQTHEKVLPKLREKYGAKVRIVVRHLPLEIHPVAPGAAKAAIAAGRQKKFWDFHDQLFEGEGSLGRQRFVEIARGLGLDIDQFQKDMDDPEVAKQIEDDVALSRRLGVQGTPGIFVNGRYVFGAHDIATYESLVDEELAEAQRLAKAGTPEAELHAALMKDALREDDFPNPTPNDQATGGDG
jgi:protein-disulfide isomerase